MASLALRYSSSNCLWSERLYLRWVRSVKALQRLIFLIMLNQIIYGMITERHNIACRLIMKAIEAGSWGECFVQMDIGSKDYLALQNLEIPVGSTNGTVPGCLFPHRFPTKQRLTPSHTDAVLEC